MKKAKEWFKKHNYSSTALSAAGGFAIADGLVELANYMSHVQMYEVDWIRTIIVGAGAAIGAAVGYAAVTDSDYDIKQKREQKEQKELREWRDWVGQKMNYAGISFDELPDKYATKDGRSAQLKETLVRPDGTTVKIITKTPCYTDAEEFFDSKKQGPALAKSIFQNVGPLPASAGNAKSLEEVLFSKLPTSAAPKSYTFELGDEKSYTDLNKKVDSELENEDIIAYLMKDAAKRAHEKTPLLRKGTKVTVSVKNINNKIGVPAYMDKGHAPDQRIEPVEITVDYALLDGTEMNHVYTGAEMVIEGGILTVKAAPAELLEREAAKTKASYQRIATERGKLMTAAYQQAYETLPVAPVIPTPNLVLGPVAVAPVPAPAPAPTQTPAPAQPGTVPGPQSQTAVPQVPPPAMQLPPPPPANP